MMVIAKKFPRNQIAATDKILQMCTRPSLAESALYSYSRGGTEITGPAIRLAEAIAQSWGNVQFGFRELNRGKDSDGVTYSDVEAYAWDLESNTRRPVSFRVRHWRDTKKGGYAITDERDIYELTANMAQRRVRACILGVIPGDVVEAAVNQCEVTLASHADTSAEAIKKMVDVFRGIGVTKEQIEARIQCRVEAIRPAQVLQLRKIFNSIKDGMSTPADWFDGEAKGEAQESNARPELPEYPAKQFATDLEQWRGLVESERQTPEALLSMVGSRYALTDQQAAQIRALGDTKPQQQDGDDWGAAYDDAQEAAQ